MADEKVVEQRRLCKACDGSGGYDDTPVCIACDGVGSVPVRVAAKPKPQRRVKRLGESVRVDNGRSPLREGEVVIWEGEVPSDDGTEFALRAAVDCSEANLAALRRMMAQWGGQ
jgi:hypothetical protein